LVVENGDSGVLPAAERALDAIRRWTAVSAFLKPVCEAHPSGAAYVGATVSTVSITMALSNFNFVMVFPVRKC
jgi:precorrin-3B methylase